MKVANPLKRWAFFWAPWALACVSCTTAGGGGEPPEPPGVLPLSLNQVEIDSILPGTTVEVGGAGFLDGARLTGRVSGSVDGRPVELSPDVQRIDDLRVRIAFPPPVVEAAGSGQLEGVLTVEARLGEAVGSASTSLNARITPALTPVVQEVAAGVFPASPVRVQGADFIGFEEGQSLVSIRGEFVAETGEQRAIDVTELPAVPTESSGWRRDAVEFILAPETFGITPGRFEGELRVDNVGATGWRGEGTWMPVAFDLLPPFVESVTPLAASRGQKVTIRGQGFLGGDFGGLTAFRLEGTFTTPDGAQINTPAGGVVVSPTWLSGNELVFSLDPEYDFNCVSLELGALPGVLVGRATPEITFGNVVIEGAPTELTFEILPSKQVVYLDFLPAFTDSLRLFGLRNLSGLVKDRVVEVIERDYAGINVEVRLAPPDDFLEFSTVEVGGPDPNAQQLFGLDNTTGLDRCNRRLDDNLAGQNADSNGAFGGVFVESFLQLSPRVGDNPLAHPEFDVIFGPVIGSPVEAAEYPGGTRDAIIERAVRTLGNLVGNTVTHEIGHSLGLPVAPGCGQFHTAPGERQLMDCGADRPFEERAELDEASHGVWNPEDRAYLERILPLP
jgi:hypothetical protein